MREKKKYQFDCVSPLSKRLLEFILDNSREVKIETFKRNVCQEDLKELKEQLGYNKDFRLENDWHISYFSSKTPKGKKVYCLCHSSIEHIFY